jgi:hypothetical protein
MAITKTVNLDVQSNLDDSAKSVGSLKSQLREAQNEVAALSDKFGATSKEAVEAAKRAAELRDRIGDAKDLTDAFNPDAKFNALTNSLSGVAGGFSAVTGAMGLLGSESAEVEQMILKVQSAMAISQGIQAVGESIDSFKQLRAVVMSYSIVQKVSTAAQWLWNTAMAANPIGAVVAVVVALIAAGYKLVTMFMDSAEANEKAMAATKKNTIALKDQEKAAKNSVDKLTDYNNHQYNLAKANGASSESLRKLALKHAEEAVALNYKNTMLARSTFLREADTLATLKANDASDEAIAAQDKLVKASYEAFDKQREGLYDSVKQKKKIINDNEVAVAQEATDRRRKEAEDVKKHNEDLAKNTKDTAKKNKEDLKKLNEDYKKQLATQDIEFDATELQNLTDANQAKKDLIQSNNEEILNQQKLFELQNAQIIYDSEEAQKQRRQEAFNQRIIDFQNVSNAVGSIAKSGEDLLTGLQSAGIARGKAGQGAMKALALVQIGVDSAVAFSKMMQGTEASAAGAASTAGPAAPAVYLATKIGFYASGAATILSNIARAKKLLTGGGESGGGGAAPTAPAAAPAAPSFNVVGAGGVNQIAQVMNDQGVPPVQAYVVASNVTSAQSLNRNIVNNATLG